MLFFASKILWPFFTPSSLLLVLALIGLLLHFRRRRKASLICLSVSLGLLTLVAIFPIGAWMLAPIENRFPPVRILPPDVTGIIVLGGAVDTDLSAARGMPSLNGDAERMTSLVYLARQYPKARLAFTGGNGALLHGATTEADVARTLFIELGVDQSRMVYENRSRNTFENVVLLKALVQPQPGQLWLLVTSAWHMPRAVGLFRQAGWPVLPYPVGYKTAGLLVDLHDGFPGRLLKVDAASHEWAGLLVYWLLGHTSALFPAPSTP